MTKTKKTMANDKDWTGNGKSVWATLGASNHTDEERASGDFYATSPRALDLLAPLCPILHDVWEPACGDGSLSKWLEARGHDVLSTDLADRGYGDGGIDFLQTHYDKEGYLVLRDDALLGRRTLKYLHSPFDILTNPPFKWSTDFILHALDVIPDGGHVIMLLKTTYLEGKDRKRRIYDVNPPRWIFQFSGRILCAKNGDFDTARKSLGDGAQAYCWMVWNKHNDEKTTELRWI